MCLIQANLWCFSVFPVGVVCTGAVLHSSPLLSSPHAPASDMAIPTVPPSGLEDIQFICDGHGGIIQLPVDQWVALPPLHIHSDWLLFFLKLCLWSHDLLLFRIFELFVSAQPGRSAGPGGWTASGYAAHHCVQSPVLHGWPSHLGWVESVRGVG